MTLDEAIEHAEEVANRECKRGSACGEEHRQLVEWLRELRDYRLHGGAKHPAGFKN